MINRSIIKSTLISFACSLPIGIYLACTQLPEEVQAATDAKTYTCKYVGYLDASDPHIRRAQQLCQTDTEVRQILAELAGDRCISPQGIAGDANAVSEPPSNADQLPAPSATAESTSTPAASN